VPGAKEATGHPEHGANDRLYADEDKHMDWTHPLVVSIISAVVSSVTGAAGGYLAGHIAWRRQHTVTRTDAAADSRQALLRREAEPLLAALAGIMGTLKLTAPGGCAAVTVIESSAELMSCASRLDSLLAEAVRCRLDALCTAFCDQDAGQDREHALARAGEIQAFVHSLLS
jgi:hypothetical protein